MYKYQKSDKFVIEIDEVFNKDIINGTKELYRIKGFSSLVFDDKGLDKLQRYEELSSDSKEMLEKKAYNKALNNVWELMKAIFLHESEAGLSVSEFVKIYDGASPKDILKNFTPQEALAKLDAYQKEQAEIKVGDVYELKHSACCVISVENEMAKVMWGSGNTGNFTLDFLKRQAKKGFIDIQSMLNVRNWHDEI